jgi:hypothetical protein
MFEHGYALLIGVDQNKRPGLALPVVKNDIAALQSVIAHPQRCGYIPEHVRVVTGTDATRSNILEGLDWLQASLEADSDENQTALVFFSGHGHHDANGTFLLPYDSTTPLRIGGLSAADFAAKIDALHPRRLLVVLDCCHAAAMNVKGAAPEGLSPVAVTSETAGAAALAAGKGRAVLSSSTGDQKSYVRSDGTMSVFTYHLVEALTGHAARPEASEVTVTEVMDYVARKVPVTAAQYQVIQQPSLRYDGTAFPIALVIGGKGIAKGESAPDPASTVPHIRSVVKVDIVSGEVTNVDLAGGAYNVEATTTITEVRAGGKVTGVKIGKPDQ